jgi:hypothetical protein
MNEHNCEAVEDGSSASEHTLPTNHLPAQNSCPVSAFVLELGKALLANQRRDWMEMDSVVRFAKEHRIQLNGEYPAPNELETSLKRFFQESSEFYAEGVNVDACERRMGWESLFMIRAFPYSSRHQDSTGDRDYETPQIPILEPLISTSEHVRMSDSNPAEELTPGQTNTQRTYANS